MAKTSLGIQVTFAAQQALTGLQQLQKQVTAVGNAGAQAGQQMRAGMAQAAQGTANLGNQYVKLQSTINRLRGIVGVTAAAILGMTGARVANSVIKLTGQFQALRAQLEFVEGSASAADETLRRQIQTFAQLGISAQAGIGAYSAFALQGVGNSERLVTSVARITAFMGLGEEQFQGINKALSQMFSKGDLVRAEEFRQQLSDQLPSAAAIAAKGFAALGNEALDSVSEIQRALDNETLRVEDFANAFATGIDLIASKEALVKNFATQWQGLQTTLQTALATLIESSGVAEEFAVIFNVASEVISELTGNLKKNDEQVRINHSGLTDLQETAIMVAGAFEIIGRAVITTMSGITAFVDTTITGLRNIFDAAKEIFDPTTPIDFSAITARQAELGQRLRSQARISENFGLGIGGLLRGDGGPDLITSQIASRLAFRNSGLRGREGEGSATAPGVITAPAGAPSQDDGDGGPSFRFKKSSVQRMSEEFKTLGVNAEKSLKPLKDFNVEFEFIPGLLLTVGEMIDTNFAALFEGLVKDASNFDWSQWGQGIVDSITSSISRSWAQSVGDFAVSFLNELTSGLLGGGSEDLAKTLGEVAGVFVKGLFGGSGSAGAAADGAIVQPFASGGVPNLKKLSSSVMNGPTMFGIGGEGGQPEAVMPLERVGGKLGVRSSGGGDTYVLNLSAIDTQSGAEFIRRNSDAVFDNLRRSRRIRGER